ncbi:hypothetical protein ACS0TY_021612 [Phlomoides rotata]
MLAGCSSSSTLLSPRHRLRSEASAQFQACHIPTMSTQRLDIPCSFVRKDGSRSQAVRPVVGLSIEKPSLRQSIKIAPVAAESRRDDFWEKKQQKKKRRRFAAEEFYDDDDEDSKFMSRVKRNRGNSENFWFHPGIPQVPFSLSCSGDNERDCFVPVPPPLPPLSNIPRFDSIITEITGLGKTKDVDTSTKEVSGSSSTSSGSRGLVIGSGSPPEQHGPITAGVAEGHNGEQNNHDYTELISLLVACAEQIGSKNIAAINHCLSRLGELASPRGATPIHRLTAYFTEALALRVARLWPHVFHISAAPRDVDDDTGSAFRALNQVSPIPKFIHFTSNEILLRAFQGKDRIHIIDFDIKQGIQWPGLFQSLAGRTPGPPSHIRITGIGESKQDLIETGDRLAGFAEAFNLQFEFHPVVDRLEDVRLWMLHVKEKETVAVNCVYQLHKMLYDASGGALRDFLGLIRSTNAEIVITGEQEGAHNDVTLDSRLYKSLRYYSAIFDSIDSSLPINSGVRTKIEEEIFGREIRNIIACEGRERQERHVGFDTWQQLMEAGGFRCRGVSEREVLQGRMMLKMYAAADESYTVEMRGGAAAITLSWADQPLYTVSAWEPV